MNFRTQPAYTLLELLIAVSIFSALIILCVGIFARTVSSSVKANVSRQKTEAARSVVDQISNDFRYVASAQTPPDCARATNPIPPNPSNGTWRGFCVDNINDALYMLLKYPGDVTYTAKSYTVPSVSSTSVTLSLAQTRGCSLPNDPYAPNDARFVPCTTSPSNQPNVLSSAYELDYLAGSNVFTGVADVLDSSNPLNPNSSLTKGSLHISINLKPAGLNTVCSALDAGTCYQLSTTLVPGGFE